LIYHFIVNDHVCTYAPEITTNTIRRSW